MDKTKRRFICWKCALLKCERINQYFWICFFLRRKIETNNEIPLFLKTILIKLYQKYVLFRDRNGYNFYAYKLFITIIFWFLS